MIVGVNVIIDLSATESSTVNKYSRHLLQSTSHDSFHVNVHADVSKSVNVYPKSNHSWNCTGNMN
jgi:hypothetical protein